MSETVLPDGVYQRLRDRIIDGGISPGATLREERIAAQMGVSRTPVREALRKLGQEGFIEYIPHKGARLIVPTPDMVREVFHIREVLEGLAARESALRADSARLLSLRNHFESLRLKIARGDLKDVGDIVHREIFELCENGRLERLMSIYRGQVAWFARVAAAVPGRLTRAFREHESIVSALESRDPDWAESVARAHIRSTLHDLLESLGGVPTQNGSH